MAAKEDANASASDFREMFVSDDDINILLLGETGIGKSTFINSLTNYLQYQSLDAAETGGLKCLIPGKFEISIDKDGKLNRHVISVGDHQNKNENTTIINAATQEVRSYVFPIPDFNNKNVRIIDTPGVCDDRGIGQDQSNLENILSYLGRIQILHGICILLKPNNARLTPAFEYCITQLLSKLEKSAGDIITFVFTNCRGTSYRPQDSSAAIDGLLKQIAKNPPHVLIKYEKENIFCLDNESFRYLAALKQNFNTGDKPLMKQSWDKSSEECRRLIQYLTDDATKPSPHDISRTISVNTARQVITELSRPLADITELINDNLTALKNHQNTLKIEVKSVDDLKGMLYVPVIDLEQIECKQPKTVCHNAKCCEQYSVDDIKKMHYKQRCHDPCYLTNVTRELVGDTELKNCAAMDGTGKCKLCGCDFSAHMHIYYETRTVNGQIEGEGIRTQINDLEVAMKEREKIIERMEKEMNQYEKEKGLIIKSMARFAHFLERNAISPFNDSYKNYIQILITRENGRGPDCNLQQIEDFKKMLNQYNAERDVLKNALKTRVIGQLKHDEITPQFILNETRRLYSLEKMGQKIKNMHEMQKKGEAVEHKNTEYVLSASKNIGFKKNIQKSSKSKGSNKVTMIHEDNKFKNNKKSGQDKSFSHNKMQNMGKNYQKQQNQSLQKGNQQRNLRDRKGGSNQNQPSFIPPLMQPNSYQGPPLNFQMQQHLQRPPPNYQHYQYQQFQYPNIPPSAYLPNPQWNNYSQNPHWNNQQFPNSYPNYPQQQQPQNFQERNQNIPMNNMGQSSTEHRRKDKVNNFESSYDELYSNLGNKTAEKPMTKYTEKKVINNEDSDSDNEAAARFDSFRKHKGNENYAALYGDDDDDDDDDGNDKSNKGGRINSIVSGLKNMFH